MDDLGAKRIQARIHDLRENTDFALALFDRLVGYAIIAVDFDGDILAFNEGARLIYGCSPDEVIGKQNIEIFFPKEFIESGQMQRVLGDLIGKGAAHYEGLKVRRDGARFPAHVLFTLTKNKSGQAVGFIEIAEDLTERKKAEEAIRTLNAELEDRVKKRTGELAAANEALEKASRAKSEFLANMSHEIRTPLNAIIGMAEILSETPLRSDQMNYVRIFKKAGHTLLNLINDILDLSKIEAGRMDLEQVNFDLEEAVEAAAEIVSIRAHEKGLELAFQIRHDVPKALVGDPHRLRQILINLMGNAIKFTKHGEVVLRVENDPEAGAPGTFLFSVSDTGIGIPADKIDSIFQDFVQADSSITRQYGGTGLGLTISRRLVESMGGRIRVESAPGKGSAFFCRLPFGIQANPSTAAEPMGLELKRVQTLVVDDNATARTILKEMLTALGASVREAENGRKALEALAYGVEVGCPYRLMLLDSKMPGTDGPAVLEQLKKHPEISVKTVMMLSSEIRGSEILGEEASGAAGYLVKPIKRFELLDVLSAALRNAPAGSSEAALREATDAFHGSRRLRILLAEDSEDNQEVVRAYLRKRPYDIDTAENGKAAIRRFKSNPYDLVLMDIQMPVMDGHSAVRIIRKFEARENLPKTPIIALSAHALEEEMQKSWDAGCNAYLTKPIQREALVEAIEKQTRRRLVGGNDRIAVKADPEVKSLLPRFFANRQKDIGDVAAALDRGDYEMIRRMGHRIKGISGYDFIPLHEMGRALEKAAGLRDKGGVDQFLSEMADYLRRIEIVED